MKYFTIITLLFTTYISANIKSTTGKIKFDINSDGIIEAEFNQNGLILGSESASANLDLKGTMSYSTVDIASNSTLGLHTHVMVDSSSDNISLSLPYADNVRGQFFTIKKISPLNRVTISSDNLIDENQSISLSTSSVGLPYVTVISHSGQWYMVNQNISSSFIGGDNLLMYWKFDDGDGVTNPADATTNGYNGDFVNLSDDIYEDGLFGSALRFGSGGAEYVHVNGAETELDNYSQVTISVWVKSDIIGTDKGIMITRNPDGSDNRLSIRYDDGGASGGGDDVIKIALSTDGSNTSYESAAMVQTTDWQHLCLTWKSGEGLNLYINGVLDVPTAAGGSLSGTLGQLTDFRIGQGPKDAAGSWDGLIDEFRVYTKALNAGEISELFQQGQ